MLETPALNNKHSHQHKGNHQQVLPKLLRLHFNVLFIGIEKIVCFQCCLMKFGLAAWERPDF